MPDRSRRKQLVSDFKRNLPDAGVYRIVNTQTGKALLGSSPNLESVRSKIRFARLTNHVGVLDYRLQPGAREHGIDALEFEVVELLELRPEMSPAEIRAELDVLEALCREQADPATLY